jgi:hypothetical protein
MCGKAVADAQRLLGNLCENEESPSVKSCHKSFGIAVSICSYASLAVVAYGADYESEIARLTAGRDQAIATASAPIQHKYRQALESLMQRAVQANDFEAAARIKRVIDGGTVPSEMNQSNTPTDPISATATLPAEFVGPWKIENTADGFKATYNLTADGFIVADGGRGGTWLVNDNQLVFLYYKPKGWYDRFDLPVRGGKLKGRNKGGSVVLLEKVR